MRFKFAFFNLSLIGLLFLFQRCGVNSNIMFKTPKGAVTDSIPLIPSESYRISADDKITFSLSTNKGADIVVNMSGIEGGGNAASGISTEYLIRSNGEVELPVIGIVNIAGMTIEECENKLEELFSAEYQEPFVQVKITNQRAIVFPGNGADARVVPLMNNNTTLMEVIASAGGIAERGKANTVKIMRKVNGKREIYVIDLSTIDGLKYADMIIQANDYIYIEPLPELAKEFLQETTPVITLLSSMVLIIITLQKL